LGDSNHEYSRRGAEPDDLARHMLSEPGDPIGTDLDLSARTGCRRRVPLRHFLRLVANPMYLSSPLLRRTSGCQPCPGSSVGRWRPSNNFSSAACTRASTSTLRPHSSRFSPTGPLRGRQSGDIFIEDKRGRYHRGATEIFHRNEAEP
jgi:hypothetical protein